MRRRYPRGGTAGSSLDAGIAAAVFASRSRSSLRVVRLGTHAVSIRSASSWPRSPPSHSSPGASAPLAVFAFTAATSAVLNGLGYALGPPLGPTVALFFLPSTLPRREPG